MAATALDVLRARARMEQARNARNENVSDRLDPAEASARVIAAVGTLAAAYADGAWPWATAHRADLVAAVHDAETRVDAAVAAGNATTFAVALAALTAAGRALVVTFLAWQKMARTGTVPAEPLEGPKTGDPTVQLALLPENDAQGSPRTHERGPGRGRV